MKVLDTSKENSCNIAVSKSKPTKFKIIADADVIRVEDVNEILNTLHEDFNQESECRMWKILAYIGLIGGAIGWILLVAR